MIRFLFRGFEAPLTLDVLCTGLAPKVPGTWDAGEMPGDCKGKLDGSGATPDFVSALAVSEKGTAPARRAISASPSCQCTTSVTCSLVASLFTLFGLVLVLGVWDSSGVPFWT